MNPPLVAFLCLGALALGGCGKQRDLVESRPLQAPADDPEFAAAYAKARASLDHFLVEMRKPSGDKWCILKIRVERDGHVEHLWIEEVKEEPDGFSGILINTPVEISSIKKGDRISGRREAVSDWAILRGDVREGGFTEEILEKRRKNESDQSPEPTRGSSLTADKK